jgi:transglutaminase-like putative cysteine protease
MTDLSIPVGEVATARERLLTLLQLTWLVAAAFLAALAYQPVFADAATFITRGSVVVVGGALLAAAVDRRGVRAGRAALAALAIGALVVSYAVLSSTMAAGVVPTLDTGDELRRGLASGFADALGDSLPITADRGPLVWVLSLTWLTGYGTVDLARRTGMAAVPLLAPIALFGLSLPLTAPVDGPGTLLVALFVVAVFVAILLRAAPRGGTEEADLTGQTSRSLLSDRLLFGIPIVAVLAVIAPLAGAALLRDDEPFDPRELRDEAVRLDRVTDPLAEYKTIVGRVPSQSLFRVSFAGASALDVQRLPVLTLDTWDGVRWTTSDRFLRSSSFAEPDLPDDGLEVTADVFVGRLPNPYLPRLQALAEVDLDDVFIDPTSGDMILQGAPENLAYQVRGAVTAPGSDRLAGARAATDADAGRYSALGAALPDALTDLGRVAQGAASAGDAMVLLETTLRNEYGNDERASGGSSAGRLERFLTERRGSPEQFAATFALVGRSLGFPTRLVLGYRVTEERNGVIAPLADIGTAQYHVWPEVRFENLGWVAFEPTPEAGQTPPERPQGQAPATTQADGGGARQQPRELGPSEAPDTPAPRSTLWRALQGVGLSIAVLAAIAAALTTLIVVGKGVRRRRQRRGEPAAQVAGAWEGILDRLGEVGMTLPDSMTPREITQATEARFGTAVTLPMAAIVPDLGRAVYGESDPDAGLVARVWTRAEEFEQNLYDALPTRDRLAARLNPRPLVRR